MKMQNLPDWGEVLRGLWLEPLDPTVKAAAEGLGVSRKALSELVNGHTGISRDLAIRLAKAFPNTSIRLWLDLQLQYDTGPGSAGLRRSARASGKTIQPPRSSGRRRWNLVAPKVRLRLSSQGLTLSTYREANMAKPCVDKGRLSMPKATAS